MTKQQTLLYLPHHDEWNHRDSTHIIAGYRSSVTTFFCFLMLLATQPAQSETVDQIVAVVQDDLVFASDIVLEAALATREITQNPFWSTQRADAEQRLIEAAAIRDLAADIPLYTPPEGLVKDRMEELRRTFDDRAAWEDFLRANRANEARVALSIQRRLTVDRYLDRNIDRNLSGTPEWTLALNELLARLMPSVRVRQVRTEAS